MKSFRCMPSDKIIQKRFLCKFNHVWVFFPSTDGAWNAFIDNRAQWLWEILPVSHPWWVVASLQWKTSQTATFLNVLYSTKVLTRLLLLS